MGLAQLSDTCYRDLEKSGLGPQDVDARLLGAPECVAIGIPHGSEGYVIPYYDIAGRAQPFYRVRLFGHVVKYKQPKNTANHVYFPKNFQQLVHNAKRASNVPYVIFCEGEKKAAACAKAGIPAVAFGGVDSWRNRSLIATPDQVSKVGDAIRLKLPSGSDNVSEDEMSQLARGMMEVIQQCIAEHLHIVICYDSDGINGTKMEVQRAAAVLAFELRAKGVPYKQIHQCVLPPSAQLQEKVALDDYIVVAGAKTLDERIKEVIEKGCFPRHPMIEDYLAKQLRGRLNRDGYKRVTVALLADLDARGKRLRAPIEGVSYYFDLDKHRLIKAEFTGQQRSIRADSDFGRMLFERYGITTADTSLASVFDTFFHGEEPIGDVKPHRVIGRPGPHEDCVRYQINDGQYVKVTADPDEPVEILDNGDEGFLFEAGKVAPITSEDLLEALRSQRERYGFGTIGQREQLPCWWNEVLEEVRLKEDPTNHSQIMTAMLFYMSPWLYKWRATQLPVELIIGEAGSGKSSLLEHRLNVLTGEADLKNAPTDIKDWIASVTNTGALHVTDNVHMVDKNLKQRLSDEMCRIVTERDPHVEMRRLYSNNELYRVPVSAVFAITGIQQPFHQVDLLQRAVLVELDKTTEPGTKVEYDSDWVPRQMVRFGGRVHWIAHHLLVLHEFLRLVQKEWNPKYQATYRLINVEQAFGMMCKVFGLEGDWVKEYLSDKADENISSGDWAIEGLLSFAMEWLNDFGRKPLTAVDISEWAKSDEDYSKCQQLNDPRRAGRYIATHKQQVAQMTGIVELTKVNNRMTYGIRGTPK